MKYSVKYKKVFDKNDNIVDIDSVEKENKECEYYSIGTHTPMIAALGAERQHYFRAKRGYTLNPETELHKYVKTILKYRFDKNDNFFIKYYRKDKCPFGGNCIFYDKERNDCEILKERLSEFDLKQYYDTATIEGYYDGYIADVLLSNSHIKRRPIFLEVAVRHPCEREKCDSGHKIVELFVRFEKDAYCDLEETRSIYDDGSARVKFYNFETKNSLKACAHHVSEKKYFPQSPVVKGTSLPTKYYCCPQQFSASPIEKYYANVEVGVLFASNKYAKPFVFDKAMSLDNKNLLVLGKDIYGAPKPWVFFSVKWNGRDFDYKVQAHFDYMSALRDFTLAQGKEWHGGEVMSDYC